MIYLLILVSFAVFIDAVRRHSHPALATAWALGSMVMPVLVVPYYLTRRPLLEGEQRSGGGVYLYAKHFAQVWLVLAGLLLAWHAWRVGGDVSVASAAGAVLLGVIPAGIALLIGSAFRSERVERAAPA